METAEKIREEHGDHFNDSIVNEVILEDMKNKKFNSFETAYITDVKIRVNPEMMDYIEDRTMY